MAKKKLRWTILSIEDLVAIKTKIAEDNPIAARNVVKTIRKKVERLRGFPESGRIVPEFGNPKLREVIVSPYRIVYRIADPEVHILRIWHGKQEIK